jgi:hypothetical protein
MQQSGGCAIRSTGDDYRNLDIAEVDFSAHRVDVQLGDCRYRQPAMDAGMKKSRSSLFLARRVVCGWRRVWSFVGLMPTATLIGVLSIDTTTSPGASQRETP